MLWRLIKLFLSLAILCGLALVVYAYVGPVLMPNDFAAPTAPVSEPITLDVD